MESTSILSWLTDLNFIERRGSWLSDCFGYLDRKLRVQQKNLLLTDPFSNGVSIYLVEDR